MKLIIRVGQCLGFGVLALAGSLGAQTPGVFQTNLTLRIMAANLTSGGPTYQTAGLNILKGLKPDIVAIQEFNYGNNSAADFRHMLDTTFGTNFVYYRESGYSIPNGIISRFPIRAAGSWDDSLVPDRGFAWARLDVPGSNDLYVVSVHLYSSGSASDRNQEAQALKNLISANFPANAWVVVAGDFNTATRSEAAVSTFKTFLSDNPIPTDAESGGKMETNEPRNKPYDYVLPSHSFATNFVPTVLPSRVFSNGLVFDSAVYTPLSDVAPVAPGDSHVSGMQHMAVVKDFNITYTITNAWPDAPFIITQPASQIAAPGSDVAFSVAASGAGALHYQWRFGAANLAGATTSMLALTNVQSGQAGDYSVVITNFAGSVTSAPASLTIAAAPVIVAQPESQTVAPGQSAVFTVTATGTMPLFYQWRFNGLPLPGATGSSYTRANVQPGDAGNYSVVITNLAGSVVSTEALLTVAVASGHIIAQWNFNSPTPDGQTTTGTLTPSIGSGTASYIGGTKAPGSGEFAKGSAKDPQTSDNSAWNTSSYPAATIGNKTAGTLFTVSTVGWQDISIAWDQRPSSTGSKYMRLRYTTNGADFIDFPTGISVARDDWESKTNSLGTLAGANNNPDFAFQIVAEFESTATGAGGNNYVAAKSGSTYAPGGTVRFDMVTVTGLPIPVSVPPTITAPPVSQRVQQGADATFSVLATGTAPLSYQWRFNATPLSGATASVYTRNHVQPADQGAYSVVVSNSAGTVISPDAHLELVVPAPVLVMRSPQVVAWQGLSNLPYVVQAKTNLAQSNWVMVGTASSPGTDVSFTNSVAAPQMFFRVRYP